MRRAATFRPGLDRLLRPGAVGGLALLVIAALAPKIFSEFFVFGILVATLLYGVAAASLIFLSAYGGMVSLAQVSIYGIAGITLGNLVATGGSKGLNLGWDPWLGALMAIAIATAIGFLFGAVASRSTGIYFLMITLTFAVMAYYFFSQVTVFSGFGGINNVRTPGLIGNVAAHPYRIYYASLIVALVVYVVIRYVVRTPFGLALQGIRDDPVRMATLGYNAPLHRMLAFGLAAFVASLAGVLFGWWNNHVDPTTIDLTGVLDLLVIAVIGGLYRLEGAWLGAFVFVVINNYVRHVPGLGHIGITEERFHTVIGAIFLAIVLLSPGGLLGIWGWVRRRLGGPLPAPAVATVGAPPEDTKSRSTVDKPGGS